MRYWFTVEYEDGTTVEIPIDEWSLRGGDEIAIVIAGEMKRAGTIPDKPIRQVVRSDRPPVRAN